MSPRPWPLVPLAVDDFAQLAAPLRQEHLEQVATALALFARAGDDQEAWRRWRTLERLWPLLEPHDRRAMRAVARRLLRGAPDCERRLAVIEKLDE